MYFLSSTIIQYSVFIVVGHIVTGNISQQKYLNYNPINKNMKNACIFPVAWYTQYMIDAFVIGLPQGWGFDIWYNWLRKYTPGTIYPLGL